MLQQLPGNRAEAMTPFLSRQTRFGDRMGCYSGRGGEVWDSITNVGKTVEKAEIKARSRHDHATPIRILLGTDAASEGLNLQQFSALINHDLPWNPMRVEQRIGRIDRIGQQAERVLIVNLYVRHTIEEDTYFTLKNRIRVFEEVVGPLQPILAEMPRILRRLARGEIELDEARRELAATEKRPPSVAIQPFEDYSIHSNSDDRLAFTCRTVKAFAPPWLNCNDPTGIK